QLVGLGGQDGTALHLLSLGSVPLGPEASEGEEATVEQPEQERLFAPALLLPLVETGGWDQAAASLEGLAEGRFVGSGLGPGVDDRPGRGPGRGDAPPHLGQFAVRSRWPNDGDSLSGGDVVPRPRLEWGRQRGEILRHLL